MARSSGDGSFDYLLVTLYQLLTTGASGISRYRPGNILSIIPNSMTSAGYYSHETGNMANRGDHLKYREKTVYSLVNARFLYKTTSILMSRASQSKNFGFSVRCVAKLATDSICPKGWEMARSSGMKSFQKLIIDSYANVIRINVIDMKENYGVLTIPLSFVHSGSLNYGTGFPGDPNNTMGGYWKNQFYNNGTIKYGYIAETGERSLNMGTAKHPGEGYSVR